ncbi:homoserine dehydrogenase [Govanella unica]|uniref:Homoserine dehydrogenase n=1 Tax=Govanella unica TaxID=2975056 RepID=A0A9X3Z7J2_9PROT|nr:homoserine dehydrogenase [Govania unica]
MNKPLRVGIAGLGTVGRGVVKILQQNGALIAARAGRSIEITGISARSRGTDRGVDMSGYRWYDNPVDMALADDVDVIVELIGGSDGVAKALAETALAHGKSLVTANKALIAHHGMALAAVAEEKGLTIRLDAAVAGGIPIIKAISDGLAANRCESVFGILNGTCNYILTQMERSGRAFGDVLDEAQRLGYAEADPSFDVDGIDTAHKLSILAAVSFGTALDFDSIAIEGIRKISPVDIRYAEELGYRIKLLGIARMTADGLDQRVQPCMVKKSNPLAAVNDVFNAVVVHGDFVEKTVYEGRGAGEGPTASAVVADLVDVARGNRTPVFSVPVAALTKAPAAARDALRASFYLHLRVVDEPGVIASITEILSTEQISIDSLLQRGSEEASGASEGGIDVILTTHETEEGAVRKAVLKIMGLTSLVEQPTVLRMVKN